MTARRQAGHGLLLRGELDSTAGCFEVDLRPGCLQLGTGALRERSCAGSLEHLHRRPQVQACIAAPSAPTKPLAVQQVGASELDLGTGPPEQVDGLPVVRLGVVVPRDQCSGTRGHARCPTRPVRVAHRLERRDVRLGLAAVTSPDRGFHELWVLQRGDLEERIADQRPSPSYAST